jgi:predicted esterase
MEKQMNINEEHISVTRTARYFWLGDINAELTEVWFVCHGQGQLGSFFLKNFEAVSAPSRLIVAPEGLSRFYLDGMSGRVGAIWMTKEDRLNEINDYINYLDALYDHIFAQVEREAVRVHVLGFSQGVATVCRWLGLGKARAEQLTLWAGQIPPDLDLNTRKPAFERMRLSIVIGSSDPYADEGFILSEEQRLSDHGLTYQRINFDGGHNLNSDVLKALASPV